MVVVKLILAEVLGKVVNRSIEDILARSTKARIKYI